MLPSSATTGAAGTHQRSKSSVLRSFMGGHKRGNSDGTNLPTAFTSPIATTPDYYVSEQNLTINRDGVYHVGWEPASPALSTSATMGPPPQRYPQAYNSYNALGELQQNRQERSSERPRGRAREQYPPPISQQKSTGAFSTVSLKPVAARDQGGKASKWKEDSPKKAKSATNLSGLLRPKSMKNLKGDQQDEQAVRAAREKDKENRTPSNPMVDNSNAGQGAPIHAQFTNQLSTSPPVELPIRNGGRPEREGSYYPPIVERPSSYRRPRPKSFTDYVTSGFNKVREKSRERERSTDANDDNEGGLRRGVKKLTWGRKNASNPGLRTKTSAPAVAGGGSGSNSNSISSAPPPTPTVPTIEMPVIDPKDIDTHLEAMLDRRNIPENQRYKMRNLSNTIKLEFIRQDWAETQAKKKQQEQAEAAAASGSLAVPDRDSGSGRRSMDISRAWAGGTGAESGAEEDATNSPKKKKHGRGLSLTIMKGSQSKSSSALNSPAKKKDGTSLGRHFRTKSSESLVVPDTPQAGSTFAGSGGYTSNFINKVKGQQMPGDFVAYLRKVQQPQAVEVGKLHKLRLLLRNETVVWIEEFIRQSGMKEIVELLHRIMALEWREEHEDALLHEVLLCLKALCTTDMALQYLHSIHTTLFPALLHMIFDPEKKGPSEFTTRGIITSILFTYIECAGPIERVSRAKAVLGFLRDPEPEGDKRPLDFVLEMRRERPYRVWCKEVVCVTKEVFWIFLHNLNIVALPGASDKDPTNPAQPTRRRSNTSTSSSLPDSDISSAQLAYMARHFPQERPPVPAAPYVGGVEWDATNYLASHLDLMNAILACTGPTAAERNTLREHMRISGWERCLGGSLRMCKEKFYGAVHDGLRTWVAAAHEDGWDVRDVRFGPPPESKSRSQSPVKRAPGAGKKEAPVVAVAPPKLEMPKFDFGVGGGMGIGSRVNSGAYGPGGGGGGGPGGGLSTGAMSPGGNGGGGHHGAGGHGSGRSRRDVYPRSPSHEGGGLWLS
ncbi:GTPase-binding protein rid1 [Podospora fimiseda]|uniref:GTPase-binding protein rid1 n=1 Tax=Podospora fimiseda TaxID=252190 RepID=A0AAN7H914_9PEZI|nr:GTPase-binding protein rid1 [Podospora fimiseda]